MMIPKHRSNIDTLVIPTGNNPAQVACQVNWPAVVYRWRQTIHPTKALQLLVTIQHNVNKEQSL